MSDQHVCVALPSLAHTRRDVMMTDVAHAALRDPILPTSNALARSKLARGVWRPECMSGVLIR